LGIDAFTIDWNGINGWFVSTVCLVARVLSYMRKCTAQEQLFCIDGNRQIISQVYLLQVKSSLMRLRAVLIYQLTKEYNTICKGNKSVFGNIDLLFRVLALKIYFGTNKY
jgi:hypothetical protein